jgi:hypothetical protein
MNSGDLRGYRMKDFLEFVRWNVSDPYQRVRVAKGKFRLERRPEGEGRIDYHQMRRFLERVFLWGVQTGQRRSGINEESPAFVADARLKAKGRKMSGWILLGKNADGQIDENPLKEKKWKPAKTKHPKGFKTPPRPPEDPGRSR